MSKEKVSFYVSCIRDIETEQVVKYKCSTDYKTACREIYTELIKIFFDNEEFDKNELEDISCLIATWMDAPTPDFRSAKTIHFIISVQKVPMTLL